MTVGPGKYDDIATQARETAKASGVVLIVLGGEQGHGFSVQTVGHSPMQSLPALLRTLADQIERDTDR